MKKQLLNVVMLASILAIVSSCTKTRKAELADDQQASIFSIAEFGTTSDSSQFSAKITSELPQSNSITPLAIQSQNAPQLHSHEVNVPDRMKFMFENMPVMNLQTREFQITFSVDRDYVTVYKIASDMSVLTQLEKSIAVTSKQVALVTQLNRAAPGQAQALGNNRDAQTDIIQKIASGQQKGTLLIPLFKYKVVAYGTLVRAKNELKEDTSRLELQPTNWRDATHIQISSQSDGREMIGTSPDQSQELQHIFSEKSVDNQLMTADAFQKTFSVAMRFIDPSAQVFTRLDADILHVYQVTNVSALNDNQKRLLNNNAGNQELLSCSDASVAAQVKSSDPNCVLVLKADVSVNYKKAKLSDASEGGSTSSKIDFEDVARANSVGLVEIKENSTAKQVDLSGVLDPNSALKVSDLQGEFYYRRTFEAASNMFLGRTGTSGDMSIIKFELQDDRLVVRNQMSLIAYTGQGPMDREELMSFPVKYIRMNKMDANGTQLTIPQPVPATKENAEYAIVDWTKNTVPDAVSPLAFYAGGSCFMANSSLAVTDTDMRLATDGVLNYSLSGSYTVNPTDDCVAKKTVNSAYWASSMQFNFNIKERISFLKHLDSEDVQFTDNISSTAQSAFNFGVFTLADLVNGNGTMPNRDGSEKYMPIIHDFRNGRVVTYHLGGINNAEATPPERRDLLVSAAQQVIDEWNKTLKMTFKGTPLERDSDYVKLIVDDASSEAHLGDLDRNYIWFQELPAENGLLGVAQPAANPRSGTIRSANVIIYTGNTFDEISRMLKVNDVSLEYEKTVEKIKAAAIAEAQKTQAPVSNEQKSDDSKAKASGDKVAPSASSKSLTAQLNKVNQILEQSAQALAIGNQRIEKAMNGMKKPANIRKYNIGMLKTMNKGQTVNYKLSDQTFLKKLTEIAVTKKAATNPFEFELELNKAFIQYGGISDQAKAALQKRSDLLAAAIRFDQNTKNRPGCYSYERTDINKTAATLDADPKKNLMINFRNSVMSTLSHELGHAFGLLHNFKASTDKANYEFKGEQTGRNYSSIMDYIADIDMHYAGPGPYDVHALRAAYTGLVEISDAVTADKDLKAQFPLTADNFIKISDVAKAAGMSYVSLSKDSINKLNLTKYFEQCDDGGLELSALCAQFDVGGSATEIVDNYIQDYNRGYLNRNYVFDKILFDFPQKVQIINRNISTFQNIRAFLDEAINAQMSTPGLTDDQLNALNDDLAMAAKHGYQFFHELIRTPSISESILRPVTPFATQEAADSEQNKKAAADRDNDTNHDGLVANEARFIAYPYTYKNEKGEDVKDIKLIEARSLFDIQMNDGVTDINGDARDGDRDKFDTIGISYDKAFAMMFLLQATAAETKDDSKRSSVSYTDFEQFFLDISDPSESPTMNTLTKVFMKNLKYGFFAPSKDLKSTQLIETPIPVQVSRMLGDKTAVGALIGLNENKWQAFDPYATMFEVSKSSEHNAPADRLNVVKAGQDRGLGDTKVYFAPQNGIGSSVLINTAARNEFFLAKRDDLFKAMDAIYNAELAKTDSAQLMADLVKQLRDMNKSGIIMPPELDVDASPINLERQVAVVRTILVTEMDLITKAKADLEGASKEDLPQVIVKVISSLKATKTKNQKVEGLPLIATAFAFISNKVKDMKVTLADKEELTGANIAHLFMNTTKINDDLDQQDEVIDTLSQLSAVVDPDTVGQ